MRIDAMLQATVLGRASDPPPLPAAGDVWMVGASASGAWLGREDDLASWQEEQWLFCTPTRGLSVRDITNGHIWIFDDTWRSVAAPAAPDGGNIVDVEARSAIAALVSSLQEFGIFSSI